MARWRLTAAHYLYTDPPTEWEYKETDRNTGRQNRMVAKVPRLLEPKDPADHNYPDEIVVCDGHNPQRRDIIFIGEPTPDMEPLDEEAEKITQQFIDSGKWRRATEGEVYGEGLIEKFLAQIAAIQSGQVAPAAVSTAGVDAKEFAEMKEQMKALMEQNAKLQAQALERPARRV